MLTTNLLNDYFTKNVMLEECIQNKTQNCFKIRNEDDSILLTNNEIKSVFQNYNNDKSNSLQLQFLVTPLQNNQLVLEIHENKTLSETIKIKIISILLDEHINLDKELQVINRKINLFNKNKIIYLLKKFNQQYKIKNGLAKIRFEELNFEDTAEHNEDEDENKEEQKELKRIQQKYQEYIDLLTLKKELQTISNKLKL